MESKNNALILLAILGIAIVGVADHVTGAHVFVFPFYFLPIAIGARAAGGRRNALLLAVAASMTWILTNLVFFESDAVMTREHHLESPGIALWNSFAQTAAFAIVAVLVADLQDRLVQEHALNRTDPLTKLANTRAFYERAELVLGLATRQRRPVTIACIDLDRFKDVNDREGHAAGDRALVLVAGAMRHVTRSTDILARMGGDEFAVVLPDADARGAETVLTRMRSSLAAAMSKNGWPITMSIGAIVFQGRPPKIKEAMRRADALMYTAKNGGRDKLTVAIDDTPHDSVNPPRSPE